MVGKIFKRKLYPSRHHQQKKNIFFAKKKTARRITTTVESLQNKNYNKNTFFSYDE